MCLGNLAIPTFGMSVVISVKICFKMESFNQLVQVFFGYSISIRLKGDPFNVLAINIWIKSHLSLAKSQLTPVVAFNLFKSRH